MENFTRIRSLRRQTLSVVFAAAATLLVGQGASSMVFAEGFDPTRDLPQVAPGDLCYDSRCYTHRATVYDHRHAVVVLDVEVITPDAVWGAGCTGALLASGRHVLTAAHCVAPAEPGARLGKVSVEVWGAASPLRVSQVSVHRRWFDTDERHTEFDVAILELSETVWWLEGFALDTIEARTGLLEGWAAQWDSDGSPTPKIVRCSIAAETLGRWHRNLTAPCGLRPGGSGGPLFSRGEDDIRIVGVLHAHDAEGVNYWSMLEPVDQLYANLIDVPVEGP